MNAVKIKIMTGNKLTHKTRPNIIKIRTYGHLQHWLETCGGWKTTATQR